jgi:hypothetical protein
MRVAVVVSTKYTGVAELEEWMGSIPDDTLYIVVGHGRVAASARSYLRANLRRYVELRPHAGKTGHTIVARMLCDMAPAIVVCCADDPAREPVASSALQQAQLRGIATILLRNPAAEEAEV